jgi:hypothetical protein
MMTRKILCYRCVKIFRGKGASRVMRKVLFHFCPKCWRNREACEEHMRKATA